MRRKLMHDVKAVCMRCGAPCVHCLARDTYYILCDYLDSILAKARKTCPPEEVQKMEDHVRRMKAFLKKHLLVGEEGNRHGSNICL